MVDQLEAVNSVFNCLDRSEPAKWTPKFSGNDSIDRSNVRAIGLDTNALKQMRRKPLLTDRTVQLAHESIALIVPGQTFHEFWNNHKNFVKNLDKVPSTLESMKSSLSKLTNPGAPHPAIDEIKRSIAAIEADFADQRNPTLFQDSVTLWETLADECTVPFVPRMRFNELAQVRLNSKVAPGHEDIRSKGEQALGDFYVWADFLLGIALLTDTDESLVDTTNRTIALLVTDDSKDDWIASGSPHPVLSTELHQLSSLDFRIMDVAEFEEWSK